MSQVNITLVRADTNQEFDVELPDDAAISDLLPALVKELGLPLTGPDGNSVAYELSNKRTGRELKEAETLGGVGTKTGDLLLLTSTFVAGGAATGLARCPECSKLISLRFPIHDCTPPKDEAQTAEETPEPEMPTPEAKPKNWPKVGATVGIRKLKNMYGRCDHIVSILGDSLERQSKAKRGAPRKWKIASELPLPGEYRALRNARFTTTVSSLIEDAYSEAESVGEELREWYENTPEGLQQTDRMERVNEGADSIENVTGDKPDDLPEALGELSAVYVPGTGTSRADRLSEAAGMLREAVSALQDHGNEGSENCERCEGSGQLTCDLDHEHDCPDCDGSGKAEDEDLDVDEMVSTLENAADELEAVECPSMFD